MLMTAHGVSPASSCRSWKVTLVSVVVRGASARASPGDNDAEDARGAGARRTKARLDPLLEVLLPVLPFRHGMRLLSAVTVQSIGSFCKPRRAGDQRPTATSTATA